MGGKPLLDRTTVFGNNMSLPIHRWFRFSAGFSAAWAESLIAERAQDMPARVVLDPFAGSGTAVIAGQFAGAPRSVGVEAHPFIARLARAKLLWNTDLPHLEEAAAGVLETAHPTEVQSPAPLLAKCYPPETLAALEGLRLAVAKADSNGGTGELLWLALVSILRECSPVGTANWQYVLPNKRKARVAEPLDAFRAKVHQILSDMRDAQDACPGAREAAVLTDDARWLESVEDDSVGFVITSPPYPNNFDYADATRLEMTFLGEVREWRDLHPAVREHLVRSCSQHMRDYGSAAAAELGSELLAPIRAELSRVYEQLAELRESRAGKKAYHWMVVAYFTDLAETWRALRRVCAPGAQVCFVVGDSAPYGVHVPVEKWLGELALSAGFRSWRFEKLRDRNHKWLNRKHRVPLHEGRLWVEG